MKEREQTTIRLPADLKKKLQQEADEKGISFNFYVLILIDKGSRSKPE
jgi:predicted HicB family RNase H-like nuclease